jgi:hypothetical protein
MHDVRWKSRPVESETRIFKPIATRDYRRDAGAARASTESSLPHLTLKRREFIGMAAAGTASVAWTAIAGDQEPTTQAILATPQLLEMLRDQRLVCELGECYRALTPGERTVEALERAILADLEAIAPATMPLDTRVDGRIQRDFADERTITLRGWILSVTEARQCALYSLFYL